MVRTCLLIMLLNLLLSAQSSASENTFIAIPGETVEHSFDQLTIHITVQHDDPSVWVRQQFRLWVEVRTADRFASLRVNELNLPGVTVVPMQSSRQQGEENTLLRAGWLLYANRPGQYQVSAAAIDYIRGGKLQQTIKIRPLEVTISALPPYVPPTMPVGKINVSSQLLYSRLLRQGSLYQWRISLQSEDSLPASFTPVLRQLRQSDDINFYPAETTTITHPGINGINAETHHVIPYTTTSNNLIALPRLRIQYFEPQSGKIVTYNYASGRVISLHILVWLLLAVLAAFVVFKSLNYLYKRVKHYQYRQTMIKQATAELHASTTPAGFSKALRNYAAAKGWDANRVVSAWPQAWPVKKHHEAEFSHATAALSRLCYAAGHDDIDFLSTRNSIVSCLAIRT